MIRKTAALLILLSCLCSQSAARAGYQPLLDSYLRNMFSDALESAIAYYQVPGAVMAVKDRGGNVAYFNEGVANLETGQAMDSSMYFHIGSVTKTFTATAILQLVDQNKVGLDDTLEKWMPGQVAGGDEIAVRDLLDMRSGLDHYENSTAMSELAQSDPLHQFTVEEVLSYANKQISPPGQTFDYNNLNYMLLEAIIEKATGLDYEQAIQDLLITPLDLTHTSVPYDNNMPSPYADGYLKITYADATGYGPSVAADYTTHFSPSIFGGAGSMISTAGDMLTWLDALLDGKVLSSAMHQAQLDTIPMGTDPTMSYGLGVGDSNGAWGHNGIYSGYYTAAVYRYLDYDIVILSNGQTAYSNQDSTAQNIFNQVRSNLDQYLAKWD